ncbi:MAG: hypothetical protein U0840_24270 [Gemmataceae bacterium]
MVTFSPLLLVFAVAAAPEPAAPPVFLDREHLFGPEAIERVTQVAEDLREQHGVGLVVETMAAAPNLSPDKVRTMKSRAVIQALRDEAQNRADELGVRGLYVLITQEPRHVTVIAYPADRERDWETSDHKREKLRKALSQMDRHDPDRTLVRAIEEFRGSLGEPKRPSPMDLLPPLIVCGGLLALWLVLLLLRRQLARNDRPLATYQPAMLGNIFGVPAGFWIYDRLFASERPLTVPASMHPVPHDADSAPGEGVLPESGGPGEGVS